MPWDNCYNYGSQGELCSKLIKISSITVKYSMGLMIDNLCRISKYNQATI